MQAESNESIVLLNHLQSELAGIHGLNKCEMNEEEIEFEKKMKIYSKDDGERRLYSKVPWRIDPGTLENNRPQAIKFVNQLKNKHCTTW